MLISLRKNTCIEIFNIVAYTLVFFLIESVILQLLIKYKLQRYWMAMPVLLYFIAIFINKFFTKKHNKAPSFSINSLVSLMLLYGSIKINQVKVWFDVHYESMSFIIIIIFLINLVISKYVKEDVNSITEYRQSNNLFNLFYINTSKVHEIAMLIDNKIMKTVEREQISEELLKQNTTIMLGSSDKWSAEKGYSKEDSSKKRVYENFDVKMTKSIMLRKIYETTQKSKDKQHKLMAGDLTIFENIELQQRNIDDTVMILNILQDSNIKNESSESLEINLNKMMDKMLDDFTIDYSFTYSKDGKDNEQYIIQLPYKSTENFENGYQHNDLQLGKLSLIGIYRGEIDFSERESISSKFLELMSDSYNQELQKGKDTGSGMKLSYNSFNPNDIQFEFHHRKLKGKLHLIDVIAIIQELNIDRKE